MPEALTLYALAQYRNPYRAYVYMTQNFGSSLPTNQWTPAYFDTILYDPGGSITALGVGGTTYTCPVGGYYYVSYAINYATNSIAASFVTASVFRNGTTTTRGNSPQVLGNAVNPATGGADVLKCNAGDTLVVQAFPTFGTTQAQQSATVSGGTYSYSNFAMFHLLSLA